ncbi:MAG TPA: hypothetical protein HA271_00945 [Methanobacterium subterraneum]|uniref:DUF4064 domain-containing protein n=1 Tax=Methanobacterium subterraneum TaxID=59277 RepID=A0A7J4TG88_9EURY|nr:hypothetical protein [Methanobacterium subterraneum]
MGENVVNKTNRTDLTENKRSRTIELALGIVGGIFGLFGGIFALLFIPELGFSAILASVVGIIGAIFVTRNPKWGGLILIISSVWLLISISFFGVLGFILLLIAGSVALFRK